MRHAAPSQPRCQRGEAGFTIITLLGGVTIMLVLMAAAMPSWKYIAQDDKEQELLFRGNEIAKAVERFQKKNGGALPPSFEVLVKGRYLRREYKDPMTKSGKWRIVRQGEGVVPQGQPGPGGPGSRTPSSPTPSTTTPSQTPGGGPGPGPQIGAIAGVASLSKEKSLRVFNGRTRYDEWLFIAGQPRVIGQPRGPQLPGGGGVRPPNPGATPSPR